MRLGICAQEFSPDFNAKWSLAEELGVDGVCLRDDGRQLDGFVHAASLAGRDRVGLVAVEIPVGGHPLHIAEKAAVADQVLGGRLIVILRGDDTASLIEAATIVSAASRARPFSTTGGRWPTPALLEANTGVSWTSVRVTPSPHQLRLPLFVGGSAGRAASIQTAIPYFADVEDSSESLRSHWDQMEARYGQGAHNMTRAGVRPMAQSHASPAMELTRDRQDWGAELVFLQPDDSTEWTSKSITDVAVRLKPRVALDDLPEGLSEFWDATVR
ncbi:LLM class flavin-dependent oxidoreductase [Gordonia rubripertincta]|uniref:LLM class flavin-dependent oxidoreductase n=1 Tax=Gordonia rubripertincta TaxID=36822 RepID=A0ABT4MZC9_GORRU|nr:LLM class flavin-dependent oxidoreductase [Gordonia rubripertincta]MCZ4551411.1 LLM class flavin-dependent oxidoreductase [Gordonia rubripertincta]